MVKKAEKKSKIVRDTKADLQYKSESIFEHFPDSTHVHIHKFPNGNIRIEATVWVKDDEDDF